MHEGKPGLDGLALRGRLRERVRRSDYERRTVTFTRGTIISDIRGPVRISQPPTYARPNSKPQMSTPTLISQYRSSLSPKAKPIADIRPATHSQPHATALHARTASSSAVLKRQIVKASKKGPLKKRTRPIILNPRKMLTAAAVLVILGGLGIGWQGLQLNKEVATKAATLGSTTSAEKQPDGASDVPSEEPVANPGTYRVASDRPRTISIEKINVHARVVNLGIKANNQLAAPGNIFDAGWYNESSKPGEAGAMVIDGHVSGPTKPGVFYNLRKLIAGDQIKIERGDGKIFAYKVIKVVTYAADKVDMAAVLTPVTKGKPGLNLITCSGELDASRNHYKDRTVIFAEQM